MPTQVVIVLDAQDVGAVTAVVLLVVGLTQTPFVNRQFADVAGKPDAEVMHWA